jgi:predicted amidohydrolase YtcJ
MRSTRASVLAFAMLAIASCCCEQDRRILVPFPKPPATDEEGADIVIIGRIRTLDPHQPDATGLVIRGGVISRITTEDVAVRYASSRTRLITVPPEGVAMPGFIESHAHLRSVGRSLRQLDLRGAKSSAEAAAIVAEAAKDAPEGSWIVGRGWNQTNWGDEGWPNRMQLDQAAPGHPVALTRVDGHAMWVSSRALDLAQIVKDKADPPGGEVMRDQTGEPTGILVDNAMDSIQGILAKAATDEESREDFLRAQAEAFRNGITTFVDAGETPEKLVLLSSLYDAGTMKLRVHAMVSCSTAAELDATLARKPIPSLFGDRLAIRAIKIYADGALGSRGAWLLEPYADRPGHYGFPVTDPTVIRHAVRGCLEHGWQLCVHAIGDRANRVVIDEVQLALDRKPRADHRFRIEHAQLVDPADIPRFRRNGVIPSIQPVHATSDATMAVERLGFERTYRIGYPYRAFLEEGLHPAVGTDAPVEALSPIQNFYAAIMRQDTAGRLQTPFVPEQRMNRLETLLGMTEYGAYAAFCDDRRGRLVPGYQGDVVVLDRDLLGSHPDFIPKAAVMATILGGEVVYDAIGGSQTEIAPVEAGRVPAAR